MSPLRGFVHNRLLTQRSRAGLMNFAATRLESRWIVVFGAAWLESSSELCRHSFEIRCSRL